jgi:predicted nucleotidyltransferase
MEIEHLTDAFKSIAVQLYNITRLIDPAVTEAAVINDMLRRMEFPTNWRDGLRAWAKANNNIHSLWLFGSRALGIARPDSDIDLGIGLMPPTGSHNWALGNYTALGDQWQSELEAIVGGRPVSLEAATPDDPGTAKVAAWIKLWERE